MDMEAGEPGLKKGPLPTLDLSCATRLPPAKAHRGELLISTPTTSPKMVRLMMDVIPVGAVFERLVTAVHFSTRGSHSGQGTALHPWMNTPIAVVLHTNASLSPSVGRSQPGIILCGIDSSDCVRAITWMSRRQSLCASSRSEADLAMQMAEMLQTPLPIIVYNDNSEVMALFQRALYASSSNELGNEGWLAS
eukprot:3052330-Amphidinium_carterae.1